MKSFVVVGMMSGTSLDGLDIAGVKFFFDKGWHFEVLHCEMHPYEVDLREKLKNAMRLSGLDLKLLDNEFGSFLGQQAKLFIDKYQLSPDLIASHGHTVFHQPDRGLTMQIGDGHRIFKKTGIKTVCDLRSMDVAFGGHGAPLVPVGDAQLFEKYDACLNLGGFSNISFDDGAGARIAFDICPVNIVLNFLADKLGHDYDKNGDIARAGRMLPDLMQYLEDLAFYKKPPPKSLGIEWVKEHIYPVVADNPPQDVLHTFCHHIAARIAATFPIKRPDIHSAANMLVTGGGAHNSFLIELIKGRTSDPVNIVVPERLIVDFKEAIVFAFLGLLKHTGQNNCLRSVTGAETDCSGGLVFYQS